MVTSKEKLNPELLGRDDKKDDNKTDNKKKWSIDDSEKLYRIDGWGDPYFSIDVTGHINVSPQGDRGGSIDLYELIESLKKRNIELPLLLRFSDILGDRIERLNSCFARAIARYNYPNVYRGVFPVKCNQNRHLVESLVSFGKPFQFGLEAGSKPELIIALAALEPNESGDRDNFDPLLICNGYKDREYIETALIARKLGQKTIIVIEQIEELYLAIASSKKLGIEPILGVRAKLTAKGSGRWGISTGDRAKFGLTIPQIVRVINELKQAGMLHCLQLLHFHIGSQISAIEVIKEAIREAGQIYVQLCRQGANMQYLDVGGGLAVDYDGSKTNFAASKNYNMQNYANDIVAAIKEACEEGSVNAPILVSESGRAIASHQSVLVFDVLGEDTISTELPQPLPEKEHLTIRNLWETYRSIDESNYQETYHDAIQFKEEAIGLFNFGYLNLDERARAEQLYWACCQKIADIIAKQDYVPDDLEDLDKIMASIYYANLSVFQSAPDSWAIDQLFPIVPIHRLNEEPSQRAILADLTCDSDGKIDRFIDLKDVKSLLELHQLDGKPYYLGMFLIGAYQEIMGNLHNLFGDTNVVHIQMTPKGYQIEHLVRGDTIGEVLGYVQYKAEDLVETIRRRTERALNENRLTLEESQILLQNYERSLRGYTYLDDR
jgi:arginine decarboxylase